MNCRLLNTFLTLLLLIFIACEEDKPPRIADKTGADNPTFITRNPVVYFRDSARTKAILSALRARVYELQQETKLDSSVQVQFYSLSGNRISILTADSAVVDDKTRDMTAQGRVVVIADSTQTTVKTSLMKWSNARQKLHSTEFVEIISPREIIRGIGFESDQNLKNYVIYKTTGIQYR